MNSKQAKEFIIRKGIPMGDSKFTKMTPKNLIPLRRAKNRLLFYQEELEEWCKNELKTPGELDQDCYSRIVESAQLRIVKK